MRLFLPPDLLNSSITNHKLKRYLISVQNTLVTSLSYIDQPSYAYTIHYEGDHIKRCYWFDSRILNQSALRNMNYPIRYCKAFLLNRQVIGAYFPSICLPLLFVTMFCFKKDANVFLFVYLSEINMFSTTLCLNITKK